MSCTNKMETKTVKELQTIAKKRGIRGYSKLKKAELISRIALSTVNAKPVTVALEGFDAWADEQSAKPTKPVKSNSWYEWLTDHVPVPAGFNEWVDEQLAKPIKQVVSAASDWIMDKVPKPVKSVVDVGFYKLKNAVNKLFGHKPENKIRESKTAIKNFAKQYIIDGIAGTDSTTFLNSVKGDVVNLFDKNRQTKVNLVLLCEMERVDIKSGEVTNTVAPFVSKTEVVLEGTDVGELFNEASRKIVESIAQFQMRGSNWRLRSVSRLEINTVTYKPLKGKSYIKLPDKLASKKAIINMKNKDDQCFKWCVTRALHPVERNHPERITKKLRAQADKLNWSGNIKFPVAIDENM